MTTVRDFFEQSDWVDHQVLRQLSHIRPNWELTWDSVGRRYEPEEDSYADLLNELILELDGVAPPLRYHDNEDQLGEYVKTRLNWGIRKVGSRWVGKDGKPLDPDGYIVMLEQGAFEDRDERDLVAAAAGRIQAAIVRGQTHFDQMERSHQYLLAGVLAAVLYHRSDR